MKVFEHLPDIVELTIHNVTDEHDDWFHDELDEAAWEFSAIRTGSVSSELLLSWGEVVVTPKFLHHLCSFNTEFLSIDLSKLGDSESPSEKG